ncbi:MAG: prepilin peptidase [Ardenticatenaceae bacterium]|nr:prepilin peptidase [Ardenticatenaceae bacterium]
MLNLLFALIGLLLSIVINVLADDLPLRIRPLAPHCPRCAHIHKPIHWLGLVRRQCPQCGQSVRRRVIAVEIGTTALFALLPSLIPDLRNLIVNSFFIAVLILVIVIDLEHKLILNVVTFPVTAVALAASFLVTPDQNNIKLAAAGAVLGLVIAYIIYALGTMVFGAGAFGMGDVKLAMAMGAMLGLHRIPFALIIGIVIGGVISLLLLATRLVGRRDALPYGQYLALGGIIMLIWGVQIVDWYLAPYR